MTVTLTHYIDGRFVEGSGAPIRDANPSRPDDILATETTTVYLQGA